MAYRYDLKIDQGATLAIDIECQDDSGGPMDLTGYTAAAQVRRTRGAVSPEATFVATVNGPLGIVGLALTSGQTSVVKAGRAYWDCELTAPGGTVQRLVEGVVRVSQEVTR